jgi:hypothetical protein
MVRNILLYSVRRKPPGPVVETCPSGPVNIAGLWQQASEHTPYHTLLLLPRLSCGTVPSPLRKHCQTRLCTEKSAVGTGIQGCTKVLRKWA